MNFLSPFLPFFAYASRARALVGYQARRKAKRHRSQFYEDVWREAATELDATFQVLAEGSFRISRGGASTRVHNEKTTLDDHATYNVCLDKPLVHTMLRSHGLPTPNHAVFSLNAMNRAYDFLEQQRLCVVKPAFGTGGGDGVTTGIETRRQLLRGAVRAAGYSYSSRMLAAVRAAGYSYSSRMLAAVRAAVYSSRPQLLVEEQVKGDTIRLLYLDGQLLDAVRRGPPTVVGDGKSRISGLVRRLNQKRLDAGYKLAQVILPYDLDMKQTLARQGLAWQSVPADGQRVVLKTVINDNVADNNERVLDQVSESIIVSGSRAAEVIGVRLVGVDIVTPDMSRRLEDVGGTILEVNTGPGYYYHYFTRDGACRVAVPILRACLGDIGLRENLKAKQ